MVVNEGEGSQQLNGDRENNEAGPVGSDPREGLQVAKLQGGRMGSDDVGSFG